MKQATYTIGCEDYSQWITRHEDVEHLVITGRCSISQMDSLARNFDYKKFRIVSLNDVLIEPENYKHDHYVYVLTYWEHISSIVCEDEVQALPLEKMFLNSENSADFLIENGNIYSIDKKTIIHMDNVPSVLSFDNTIENIGNFAFANNDGENEIESVTIPASLKKIGAYAFANAESLNDIKLPDTIIELGEGSFEGCFLENVTLSANLKEISERCFKFNEFEHIEIPSSVASIGDAAFHGCGFLEKTTLHEGLKSIGYDAFECLTEMEIPSSVTYIAPDFYYEDPVDDNGYPPYIKVSPLNPVFYSKDGSLYFKKNNELALDHAYNGTRFDDETDEECRCCPVHDYNIRQIRPSDDKQILQITRRAFEEFGAPLKGSIYCDPRMEHLSQEFDRDDAEYWIVEDKQGKVLGGCGFYPTEDLPEGMAEVVKFYFSPELRGKGLAPKLLMLIEAHAKKAGYNQLYIESFPEFRKAVELYEKYGFKHIDHALGNSGHPAVSVWMTKDIFKDNQQ